MKRKHKQYSRPKRPFDKLRIEEEGGIKEEFGLKNKREIWKAETKIKEIREKAKNMILANEMEKKEFFSQLQKIGFKVNSIAEVLGLEKRDYLNRRLQTIVLKKRIATTPKGARQLITHKKILVDKNIVNIPSYIVPVNLEDKIRLKPVQKKKEKEVTEDKNEENIE